MFARFKIFYRQVDKKIIFSIASLVILPIIILRLLGILQPIELTAYDLLFYLSSQEPLDERIVLVTWTEDDIQTIQEDTMSDRTLSFVLEKVREQQPRLIALDLYRDIPRPSYVLSNQENQTAYNRLQKIFEETDNLMAIEKVRKPIIKTSKVISQTQKDTCSDVINDVDNYVRRAFIDCQPIVVEGDSIVFGSSSYLGTALGAIYLKTEGWEIANADTDQKTDSSLKLSKGDRTKVLTDLPNFRGFYVNNDIGADFLINWRRNKKPFQEITVSQLSAESFRSNIFRNKIVIIGNTASSTVDRHQIPIVRWNDEWEWTYGVYIPAHVASSIISSGLDDRPLLKMAPLNIDYWSLILFPFLIVRVVYKYYESSLTKLLSIGVFIGLICSLFLVILSLELFEWGIIFPIVPAIGGIWGSIAVVNNHIQFKKEQENFLSLKNLAINLNHSLRNIFTQIGGSTNELNSSVSVDRQYRKRELKEKIKDNNTFILGQVDVALSYINNTSNYIERNKLKDRESQLVNLEESIKQIARKSCNLNLKRIQINYLLKEDYDPALENELINYHCIEAVISNLISNAFTAMNMRKNRCEKRYLPTINISTKDRGKFIKIVVEDNGVGVSLDQQKKIFKPRTSYTLGQGIGLNIVESFLLVEKGTISFESQEGRGTKFTILIPKRRNRREARFF